jgi:hypothetical protein
MPAFPLVLVRPPSLSFPCARPVGGGAVAAAPTAVVAGAALVLAPLQLQQLNSCCCCHRARARAPSLVPAGPPVCVRPPVEVGSKVSKVCARLAQPYSVVSQRDKMQK